MAGILGQMGVVRFAATFPTPSFETDYIFPVEQRPEMPAGFWGWLDLGFLVLALALAVGVVCWYWGWHAWSGSVLSKRAVSAPWGRCRTLLRQWGPVALSPSRSS